jgi:iron-sulfur cluster assembly protein/iron-sulfur cluster insertion protein
MQFSYFASAFDVMTEGTIQETVVQLTESAANEVRQLQANDPANLGKPLRIFVEGGGCSGMQYGMVFDERRDGDSVGEFFGVEVVVDAVSAEHLQGTVVDFSDELNSGGFKISNPRARQSCGCGKSFGT